MTPPTLATAVLPHRSRYPDPITFDAGESVRLGRRDYQFPGWIRATTADDNEGWAPETYLRATGDRTAVAIRPYTARELDTDPGEPLYIHHAHAGWLWVENGTGDCGWVPAQTVSRQRATDLTDPLNLKGESTMTPFSRQLVDIWHIHSRINLDILDTIDEAALNHKLDHYDTTIGGQFAHIHLVRILWLRRTAVADEALQEIPEDRLADKAFLRQNLTLSAARITTLLEQEAATGGQPAFFQPHLGAFVGYLLAHECMHHGEIGLISGRHGRDLPLEIVWDWSLK